MLGDPGDVHFDAAVGRVRLDRAADVPPTIPPLVVSVLMRPVSPVTSMPPLTVANSTSAAAGTLIVYRTSVPPMWKICPPRGSLVSTLIRLPLELSRISIRSSASFAASGDPARALQCHDLDRISFRRLDLDPPVHVPDLDPSAGRELIGLPPLGRLVRLEIGGDDVAAGNGDEQDRQESEDGASGDSHRETPEALIRGCCATGSSPGGRAIIDSKSLIANR